MTKTKNIFYLWIQMKKLIKIKKIKDKKFKINLKRIQRKFYKKTIFKTVINQKNILLKKKFKKIQFIIKMNKFKNTIIILKSKIKVIIKIGEEELIIIEVGEANQIIKEIINIMMIKDIIKTITKMIIIDINKILLRNNTETNKIKMMIFSNKDMKKKNFLIQNKKSSIKISFKLILKINIKIKELFNKVKSILCWDQQLLLLEEIRINLNKDKHKRKFKLSKEIHKHKILIKLPLNITLKIS